MARNSRALQSVSDTALLVAYHRALETKRPDALFKDELASRLSEERGEQVARTLFYGRAMAWSTVVRTVLIDELVLRLAGKVDAVVNLAAGLDTRPYRLPLSSSLRWIEVDLPDMVRKKTEALAEERPICALERVPLDLSNAAGRRELFARIGARSANTLVITEGLLMYLPPDVVGAFADDLHAQPSFGDWIIDIASPKVQQRVNRWWGRKLKQAGTTYQFAPEEGTRFFEPHGWREANFYVLFEHGIRLRRTPRGMWMFDIMKRIAPRRTERQLAKWRAGVAWLRRT